MLRSIKYLFSDDKREMDYIRSKIARAFKENIPFIFDGIGQITKSGSEYRFSPDKKLQQLFEIAEHYPEPIVPVNSSTKKLYGIDTIGDGGWHLDDWGACWTQYLQYVNGELVFLENEEVSDEWDDEKKSVPDDAPRFHKKTAKHCPLVCTDTKWSIKKAELENQDDKIYINSFLDESVINFDEIIKQVMSDAYKGLIKFVDDDELHVVFIKKMNCSLDSKSKLIRFAVYWVFNSVY